MLMSKYDVFELVAHLRKCPDNFLRPSSFVSSEGIDSIALICDAYRITSNIFLRNEFNLPAHAYLKSIEENHWHAIHISVWLLHHQNFVNNPLIDDKLFSFWFEELEEVSAYVQAKDWVGDDERAEEMVRLFLNWCEIIPDKESYDEATDKLSSISSVERHKVLKKSYEAHERIMNIQREMAEQKAREAANTYGRE